MTREDLEKFKSTILGWITSAGGGAGPFAPSPHDMSSAHHSGNISDAQHGSRTVANAHRHNDMSNIGPNDHHAQQHALDGPDHTGTLGAGQLPAITITEADAGTATPASVGPSGATAGWTREYARENHQHIINLLANYVWTGLHTFQGLLTTRHIEPETGELYDIGSVNKRYRTARVAELAATLFSKEEVMILGNKLIVAKDADILPLDMTNSQTTYDFGRMMTVGDWLQINAEDTTGNPSMEWLLIGSLISGTTYNVTRDVDGSGPNAWAKGTPFVIIGKDGDYRVEMQAGSDPKISIVRQGAVWNENFVTSRVSKVGVSVADKAYGDGASYKLYDESGNALVSIHRHYASGKMIITGDIVFGTPPVVGAPGGGGGLRISTSGIPSLPSGLPLEVNGNPGAPGTSISLRSAPASGPSSPGHPVAFVSESGVVAPALHHDPYGPIRSIPFARGSWTPSHNVANQAVDCSGNGQHLSVINSYLGIYPVSTYSALPYLGAWALDGTPRYLSRADPNLLTTTLLAYGGWFYLQPYAAAVQGIMGQGCDSNAKRQSFLALAGTRQPTFFTVDAGGTQRSVSGPTLNSDGWHFIVGVFVADNWWYLFLDGLEYYGSSFSGNLRASATTFDIGRLDGTTYPMTGRFEQGFFSAPHVDPPILRSVYESTRGYKNV